MKDKTSVSHDDFMIEHLRANPEFAVEYLKGALEEEEPAVILIVLRRLTDAFGGTAGDAKATGLQRSLNPALSKRGNPNLSTLLAVTKIMGLRLTVKRCAQSKAAATPLPKVQKRKRAVRSRAS